VAAPLEIPTSPASNWQCLGCCRRVPDRIFVADDFVIAARIYEHHFDTFASQQLLCTQTVGIMRFTNGVESTMLQNLFQRWKDRRALPEFKAIRERDKPLRDSESEEVVEPHPAPRKKVNCLLTFVDPKDPFAVGPVAGEELTGPILSILSTREFDSLFLFYTPHTRANALATSEEVQARYPQTRVVMTMELILADPKNYSTLLGLLTERVRIEKLHLELRKPDVQAYICISSGTAEMRGAWFLLTSLGVLPAKLLQVGTPAQPLLGGANVKEIAVSTSDWQSIRDLAMPAEYFRTHGYLRRFGGVGREIRKKVQKQKLPCRRQRSRSGKKPGRSPGLNRQTQSSIAPRTKNQRSQTMRQRPKHQNL
jgi:Regulator of RNA terminal phosphate cyclase